MREVLTLFDSWGNWGRQMGSYLSKVTWVSARSMILKQALELTWQLLLLLLDASFWNAGGFILHLEHSYILEGNVSWYNNLGQLCSGIY